MKNINSRGYDIEIVPKCATRRWFADAFASLEESRMGRNYGLSVHVVKDEEDSVIAEVEINKDIDFYELQNFLLEYWAKMLNMYPENISKEDGLESTAESSFVLLAITDAIEDGFERIIIEYQL